MATPSTKNYKLGIDIEAVGNEPVAAIGMVVVDDEGLLHYKKEWWLEVDQSQVDSRCKNEFWDRIPGLWDQLIKEGKPVANQIKDFVKEFDSMSERLGIEEIDLKIAGDNHEFDLGRLTPYVKQHCNREPLRYTTKGDYRSLKDFSDAVWELGIEKIIHDNVDKVQVHDHRPSNDAEHTLIAHLISEKVLHKIKEKYSEELKDIAQQISQEFVENILSKTKKRQREEEGTEEHKVKNRKMEEEKIEDEKVEE